MRELTPAVQQDARRTQLRRHAQSFRANLDALITALVDDDLSDLAHKLTDGASVPRERQGKVIGRALLAGAGELAILLGELDGAEAQAFAEAQRADLAQRRQAMRPGGGGVSGPDSALTDRTTHPDANTGPLPPAPGRPLLAAQALRALPGAEWTP